MQVHLITAVINVFWLISDNHFRSVLSESPDEWERIAQAELHKALNIQLNTRKAKNIIFFLGDGMGMSTLTSGRIYKGQLKGMPGEEGSLVFEQFPHLGLSKTYNDNSQVPDSAGTATAYFCGQKAAIGVIGVDSTVRFDDCASMAGHTITSVLKWAQDYGKATGLVTTTRITHATPAGTYAHTPNRDWEADSDVPEEDRAMCPDIAKQLIDGIPGRNINVIMGGGSLRFVPNDEIDDVSGRQGLRLDGQNLMDKWKRNKAKIGAKARLVTDRYQLHNIALDTDYVLGLFSGDHLEYELKRERIAQSQPSLTEMTRKAIQLLLKYNEGFFLAVEGGKIDLAHHENHAKLALHELHEFDRAIQTALAMVPLEDTLIIVTADHSHSFTMNGFPERGNDILKFAEVDVNGWPYTTLSYANGPSATDGRTNLTNVDTTHEDYRQESLVPLLAETHGGEDVAIYAQGPFSHLFHSLHEQHYIAHVMDYAGCYRKQYGSHCSQNVYNNVTGVANPYLNLAYQAASSSYHPPANYQVHPSYQYAYQHTPYQNHSKPAYPAPQTPYHALQPSYQSYQTHLPSYQSNYSNFSKPAYQTTFTQSYGPYSPFPSSYNDLLSMGYAYPQANYHQPLVRQSPTYKPAAYRPPHS